MRVTIVTFEKGSMVRQFKYCRSQRQYLSWLQLVHKTDNSYYEKNISLTCTMSKIIQFQLLGRYARIKSKSIF